MNNNNILDEITEGNPERDLVELKRQEKILVWVFCGISLLNGILVAIDKNNIGKNIPYIMGSVFGSVLFACLFGFLLGCLFTFIPYKDHTYRQKFWRAFFICGITFSILFFLILLNKANLLIRDF